jgi:hypothetical protein
MLTKMQGGNKNMAKNNLEEKAILELSSIVVDGAYMMKSKALGAEKDLYSLSGSCSQSCSSQNSACSSPGRKYANFDIK